MILLNNESQLIQFIELHKIKADHLRFEETIHTVFDCVRVSGFPIKEITKSIVMIGEKNELIVALVPAKYRVSTKRVGKLFGSNPPTIATPQQAFELSGYPVGGMPFIGFPAIRFVDYKVTENTYIYTGGGSERSLLKLWVNEILKLKPIIGRIRK